MQSHDQTKPQSSLGNVVFIRVALCSDNNSIIIKGVWNRYWRHWHPLPPSLMTYIPACHQPRFHCHFSFIHEGVIIVSIYRWEKKVLHLREVVFSRWIKQWWNCGQKVGEERSNCKPFNVLMPTCWCMCVPLCVCVWIHARVCVCLYVFEDAFVCVVYEGWKLECKEAGLERF